MAVTLPDGASIIAVEEIIDDAFDETALYDEAFRADIEGTDAGANP